MDRYVDHDDECEKVLYGEEGICTCDGPRAAAQDRAARRDNTYDTESGAPAWLEDYLGPALDW